MSVHSTALLACPHCGHPAMIEELHPTLPNGEKDTLYRVRCTLRECQSSTLDWYPADAAVTAWNRRANSPICTDDGVADRRRRRGRLCWLYAANAQGHVLTRSEAEGQ